MAISVSNLFQERKYPFFFALTILFLCALISFLLSSSNDISPSYYLQSSTFLRQTQSQSQSKSFPSPMSSSSPPPPPPLSPPSLSPPPQILEPIIHHPPPPPPSPPPPASTLVPPEDQQDNPAGDFGIDVEDLAGLNWDICKGPVAVDYIPCLDNMKAIKRLKSRKHMEHKERHCPSPSPRCLVPLPAGYRIPIPWPKSRDMIWYNNVPHPKLVEYKKVQNWVRQSGDYFVFPGGGTQFKEGVSKYVEFIEKTVPDIKWGKNIRAILDVGCGVASFGGSLLDKDVLTMSFAPKDEHEAQIQFALERGIPATISVIGTQKLTFPDNAYDLIHCARCRVHWDGDGGKPLMELNRIMRPGGYFIWSATPVYRNDEKDQRVWKAMVALTKAMCWKVVVKTMDPWGVGFVIYQKPISSICYEQREGKNLPICEAETRTTAWYSPLLNCLNRLPENAGKWPRPWPERLTNTPLCLWGQADAEKAFSSDNKEWSSLVRDVYLQRLGINWTNMRNVMDMNAGFGGFAAALIDKPLWVMNIVPIHGPDTLTVIFDRGLIGIYHDWCESLSTYPRAYDLLHSAFMFTNLTERCDIIDAAVEMDRIVRPGGWILVQDTKEIMSKLGAIFRSLNWSVSVSKGRFLVGNKGFWRPSGGSVQR